MLNAALVRVTALFWAIWLCENDITFNNKLIITLGANNFDISVERVKAT